ncbi:MAG TPA: YdeI/OmpD-associated family protein [Chitinophagaceae bacterium]|nr:YdeI/OmpD-associated family protein [Chitinophagaceae bacterium]
MKPLVDKKYKLEKFPGKGGWTYARIPEILQDKHAHFGWVRVRGSIDGYEIRNYHLMPMGNGQLFLPVKAAIRKVIKKTVGDQVHVILYSDNLPVDIPEELHLCLEDEPAAYEVFKTYSDGEKKAVIEWIFSAKKEETKIERITKTIADLLKQSK